MALDIIDAPRWRAIAGVGVGYGLACALILVAFFLVPYLVVTVF